MEINQEVIAIYGYSQHIDPDGRPSRNDSRYIEKNLYLYEDFSFKIIEQNGRLDPKYESKTGNWEIIEDELILHINQKHFIDFSNHNVTEPYTKIIKLIKKPNYLLEPVEEKKWEYQQGIRPEELFSKYHNKN